jgi:hypothetical protein
MVGSLMATVKPSGEGPAGGCGDHATRGVGQIVNTRDLVPGEGGVFNRAVLAPTSTTCAGGVASAASAMSNRPGLGVQARQIPSSHRPACPDTIKPWSDERHVSRRATTARRAVHGDCDSRRSFNPVVNRRVLFYTCMILFKRRR